LAAIAALGMVLAGCGVTQRAAPYRAFVPPPPRPAEAPEPANMPDPPPAPAYAFPETLPAPRPVAIAGPNHPDLLLERSTLLFAAGKRAIQEGQTERAREAFDQALGLLTSDPLPENPTDRRRIVARIEELADAIYHYDLDQLGARAASEESVPDDSLDKILEMTFPVDPSLRGRVREQIQATVSELPLEANDAVLSYIHYFLTERGRRVLTSGFARSGRYRDMILRILSEEGLPQQLLFVAQLESRFDPRAVSNKRAVGMWQFMKVTGLEYGLTQTAVLDLRRDPEKATRAAARYLRELYEHYGDWYLALAAYNCGPGCVDNAIMRTGYADFWELRRLRALPLATANYVPLVLAMTILYENRGTYSLTVEFDAPVAYDSHELQAETSLTLIAAAVDRPVSEVMDLNPALLKTTAPAGYILRLPPDTLSQLEAAFAVIPAAQRKSWRIHKVEEGDTLASVGKRYKISEAQVSAVNHGKLPEPGAFAAIPVPYPADAPRLVVNAAPKKATAKAKPNSAAKPKTSASAPAKKNSTAASKAKAGSGGPGSASNGKASKGGSARASGA
jgi:membrane-bound lytic murein transglycosylase D